MVRALPIIYVDSERVGLLAVSFSSRQMLTFGSLFRYDATEARLRSRRSRLSLRGVARANGDRHSEPFVHRGRPVQREPLRNFGRFRTRSGGKGIAPLTIVDVVASVAVTLMTAPSFFCFTNDATFSESSRVKWLLTMPSVFNRKKKSAPNSCAVISPFRCKQRPCTRHHYFELWSCS